MRPDRSAAPARPMAPLGMTLIEVLVALAIVAIALATGIKAAGGLASNAERLSDITLAQYCAENKLMGMRLAKVFPPVGDSEFGCEQAGRNFLGRMRVTTTPNPAFRKVDIRMFNEQGDPVVPLRTVVWQ